MLEVVINNVLVPLIVGGVSAWTSWFLARKKYNSEVDNNNIKNMQESLEFYMKLSDDNSKRLEDLLQQNTILNAEVRELRSKVFDLTMNICLDFSCKHRIRENAKTKQKIVLEKE